MKQALLILLLGVTLCTRAQSPAGNPLFRHIPPDADHVYHLNSPVLFRDFDWNALLASLSSGPAQTRLAEEVRGFLFQAGIDPRQDILIATSNLSNPDSFRYITFIFHLADSGKYIRYLHQKIKPLRPQPIRGVHSEGSMLFGTAFTDRLGVLISAEGPANQQAAIRKIPSVEWQIIHARRAAAMVRGFDRGSFANDPAFLATFGDGADLHFYTRQGSNIGVFNEIAKRIVGRSELLDIVNTLGHSRPALSSLRAEKGRLIYTSSQAATPAEIRLAGRPLDEKLLAAIPPGKKVYGITSISIDLAGFMAKTLKEGWVHNLYKNLALDTADLRQALDGHLLLLSFEADQATIDSTHNQAPLFFGIARIGNPASFEKLTGRLESLHIHHIVRDSLVFFGREQGQVQTFFTPVANDQPVPLPEPTLTYPFALQMNLGATIDYYIHTHPADDTIVSQQDYIPTLQHFDRFDFATGGIHNGRINTWFQATLVDREKNPILMILQMIKGRAKQ